MALVSGVYAKALFEVAKEKNKESEFLQQLNDFAAVCFGEASLEQVMVSPAIDLGTRKQILRDILAKLSIGGVVARFLELLSDRSRLSALREIISEYEAAIEGAKGVRFGEVRSAVELSSEELTTLRDALSKRLGFGVKLNTKVDPSILGGVVATVGGKTFDGSLKTQLERFKNELI